MTGKDSFAPVNRLTRAQPDDLDPLLRGFDPRARPPGQDITPCPGPAVLPPLNLARKDGIAVGVALSSLFDDPADVAFRLSALAIEQDVEVIVLSTTDYSGIERFGFRTEKVAGETEAERDACRDQLRQFWGIELTLPA